MNKFNAKEVFNAKSKKSGEIFSFLLANHTDGTLAILAVEILYTMCGMDSNPSKSLMEISEGFAMLAKKQERLRDNEQEFFEKHFENLLTRD